MFKPEATKELNPMSKCHWIDAQANFPKLGGSNFVQTKAQTAFLLYDAVFVLFVCLLCFIF